LPALTPCAVSLIILEEADHSTISWCSFSTS
jgi:hypothetical protein